MKDDPFYTENNGGSRFITTAPQSQFNSTQIQKIPMKKSCKNLDTA